MSTVTTEELEAMVRSSQPAKIRHAMEIVLAQKPASMPAKDAAQLERITWAATWYAGCVDIISDDALAAAYVLPPDDKFTLRAARDHALSEAIDVAQTALREYDVAIRRYT